MSVWHGAFGRLVMQMMLMDNVNQFKYR
jgi:hypothetical protein